MAYKRNKRNTEEFEGTSNGVAMEDILKLDQEKKFTDTECKIEKYKQQLQWGDIYRDVKERTYTELIEG